MRVATTAQPTLISTGTALWLKAGTRDHGEQKEKGATRWRRAIGKRTCTLTWWGCFGPVHAPHHHSEGSTIPAATSGARASALPLRFRAVGIEVIGRLAGAEPARSGACSRSADALRHSEGLPPRVPSDWSSAHHAGFSRHASARPSKSHPSWRGRWRASGPVGVLQTGPTRHCREGAGTLERPEARSTTLARAGPPPQARSARRTPARTSPPRCPSAGPRSASSARSSR